MKKFFKDIQYYSYKTISNIIIQFKILINKIKNPKYYKDPEKYIPIDTIYCYGNVRNFSSRGFECDYCIFHSGFSVPGFHKYAGWEEFCLLDGGDCCWDSCKTCGMNDEGYYRNLEAENYDK